MRGVHLQCSALDLFVSPAKAHLFKATPASSKACAFSFCYGLMSQTGGIQPCTKTEMCLAKARNPGDAEATESLSAFFEKRVLDVIYVRDTNNMKMH